VPGAAQTSENAVNAKFREFPFQLDFSHLNQTGWIARLPSAQRETISRWLLIPLSELGEEASSSAPKGVTPRLLAPFAGSVSCPFGPLCPVPLLVRMRGDDFGL
jgi:hypothetical protein